MRRRSGCWGGLLEVRGLFETVAMRRIVLMGAVCTALWGADPKNLVQSVAGYEFGGDAAAVRELETLTLRTAGTSGAAARAVRNAERTWVANARSK